MCADTGRVRSIPDRRVDASALQHSSVTQAFDSDPEEVGTKGEQDPPNDVEP